MNRDAWRQLKKTLFFTSEEVADLFSITGLSAQVFCSRQVKAGALIRLKKDFYVLEERCRGKRSGMSMTWNFWSKKECGLIFPPKRRLRS